ncbi:MAG: transposon-encoded TnpW family protein [Clostridiales bacterium]|nr:transposon-encoded TnpW family protein [Clostridiales bacterium]
MKTTVNQSAPVQTASNFKKKIGQTTYLVHVHFKEDGKETLQDKIKRLLSDEARKM